MKTKAMPVNTTTLRQLAMYALALLAPFTIVNAEANRPEDAAAGFEHATATFAGGCFWCMEQPFDQLDGVVSTTVGYTGGHTENPTYEQVSTGGTGHAEAVQITYDAKKVSYATLLAVFWRNIDPLTPNGQFCDKGNQYRSAIFYHNEEQRRLAEESKTKLEESGRFHEPIVTEISPFNIFYVAEDYHQNYSEKNPLRYKLYRFKCGRDNRLKEVWGKSG